jgi:hypothetical protein
MLTPVQLASWGSSAHGQQRTYYTLRLLTVMFAGHILELWRLWPFATGCMLGIPIRHGARRGPAGEDVSFETVEQVALQVVLHRKCGTQQEGCSEYLYMQGRAETRWSFQVSSWQCDDLEE